MQPRAVLGACRCARETCSGPAFNSGIFWGYLGRIEKLVLPGLDCGVSGKEAAIRTDVKVVAEALLHGNLLLPAKYRNRWNQKQKAQPWGLRFSKNLTRE